MAKIAAQTVKFPDQEPFHDAFRQAVKAESCIEASRSQVFIDMLGIDTGSQQRIPLQIENLGIRLGNPHKADQHCVGAIKIGDFRDGLLAAGFKHVEIVDSGADLNAHAEVGNQAGCCSASMNEAKPNGTNALHAIEGACCAPAPGPSPCLHDDLTMLLSQHDINAAAASV